MMLVTLQVQTHKHTHTPLPCHCGDRPGAYFLFSLLNLLVAWPNMVDHPWPQHPSHVFFSWNTRSVFRGFDRTPVELSPHRRKFPLRDTAAHPPRKQQRSSVQDLGWSLESTMEYHKSIANIVNTINNWSLNEFMDSCGFSLNNFNVFDWLINTMNTWENTYWFSKFIHPGLKHVDMLM